MKKLFSFKKVAIYTASFLFLLSLGLISSKLIVRAQVDASLVNRLSGRILLQVEANGEAWYLNPDNNLRYFLNRPNDAFNIMRELGLGISEESYNNFSENGVPSKYSGKILLRVEKNGEAYYINPETLEMHYLGRPADAFNIMRTLGLGITNDNLNKINVFLDINNIDVNNEQEEYNNDNELEVNTEIKVITQKPTLMTNFTHIISLSASISKIDNIAEKGILYKYTSIEGEELTPTLDDYEKKLVDSSNNNNTINVDITNLIPQTYPHIRAYVRDRNNNIHYGNIETIDSVGRKGTPARPLSSTSSNNTEEELPEYTLTYTAGEGGYVKLGDMPAWEEKTPLANARTSPGSVVIDGKIYVVGGTDDWDDNNYFSVYDPETDTWDDTKALMNIFRNAPLTVELDNKIYVVGGRNDSYGAEDSAEAYNLEEDKWEYIASTTVPRIGPVGGVYNGEIYVFGGMTGCGGDATSTFEIYNPTDNEWRMGTTTMPYPETAWAASTIVGDKIYIIGGRDGGGGDLSNNFYSYNFETETWNTELEKLPALRAGGNSISFNNKILYIGGFDINSNRSNNIYEYDIENKKWITTFDLPEYIHRPAVEIIDDYMYVIGGSDLGWDSLDTNYKVKYQDIINLSDDKIIQTVYQGENGIIINAIPDKSQVFTSWSDGSIDNPRTDLNVASNIDVTANFELIDCGDDVTFTYNGVEVTYGVVLNQDTGMCWLDRNLGATQVATASDDPLSYGDLFQWGRLDDGHQLRTSSATSTLSSADDPGHGDFITNTSSPYDWRSPQNNNLWQGVEGINNPCPSGFRLPTQLELSAERLSWSSNNSSGAFNSPLKWSVAGYRNNDGSLFSAGSYGVIWSSSVSGSDSSFLHFYSSDAGIHSSYRAHGLSVRCLRD